MNKNKSKEINISNINNSYKFYNKLLLSSLLSPLFLTSNDNLDGMGGGASSSESCSHSATSLFASTRTPEQQSDGICLPTMDTRWSKAHCTSLQKSSCAR